MSEVTPSTAAASIQLQSLQLSLLAPDAYQIRKHFDAESLQSLADSLKQNGMIQPIVVRPRAEGEPDYAGVRSFDYKIIAGERRYRAAKLAGIEHVPVIVRHDLASADITVIQVLENLQREDLSLAETCAGVAKLVEQLGFAKTCEQLGKSEAWVSKHAGVMKLPDAIKKLIGDGKIESVDVAKELATLSEISPKKAEWMLRRLDPNILLAPTAPDAEEGEDEDAGLLAEDEDDDDGEVYYEGRLVKLESLTPEQLEHYQLRRARHAQRAPTRSEIRLEVLEAKAELHKKQEAKERKAAEKAAIKADPALLKKAAKEKAEAEKRKGIQLRIEKATEYCNALADKLTVELNEACGFAKPKRNSYSWTGDVVIEVRRPHFSTYDQREPPAAAESANYTLDLSGKFDQIATAAKLLAPEGSFDVQFHGEVTLLEAKKLAEVLGHRVRFSMRENRTGKKLVATLAGAKGEGKGQIAVVASAEATDPHGIAAFVKACVRKNRVPTRRIAPAELHAAYVTWCKAQKRDAIPIKHNAWGKGIAAAGIEKVRSNGFWYVGIDLIK